jgi:phospholipase C
VYDLLNLDRLPRRYAVEAGRSLTDTWASGTGGAYSLAVYGPNVFLRSFTGSSTAWTAATFAQEILVGYNPSLNQLLVHVRNVSSRPGSITLTPNNKFVRTAMS